jgi:hypothetical protein
VYADRVVFLRDGHLHTELSFSPDQEISQRLHAVMEVIEDLPA